MENYKLNSSMLNLRKLHTLINRAFRNLESLKALESQIGASAFIVGYLYDHRDKKVTQKDLIDRFSLTKASLSRSVSLLENKNYIVRSLEGNDKRFRYLTLTEKGKEVASLIEKEVLELDKNIIEGFTFEEKELFLSFVRRATENLKKLEIGGKKDGSNIN